MAGVSLTYSGVSYSGSGLAVQQSEHLPHLLPADPHQEGVVPAVGLAAQNEEAGLGIGEGVGAVGGLGQAVGATGTQKGAGELDGAAGGVALVDLELTVDPMVAHR